MNVQYTLSYTKVAVKREVIKLPTITRGKHKRVFAVPSVEMIYLREKSYLFFILKNILALDSFFLDYLSKYEDEV